MKFDPVSDRKSLEELMIPMARDDEYAEAFQSGLLESYGNSILSTAVECLLLGLFDTGDELLRKARAFLRAAIEHKEVPPDGPGATEEYRLEGFAMCQWLLAKKHDVNSLKEAVSWRENWFDERGESDKTDVQLTLAHYLDAEEYDALFRRFEAARLKPPKNLRTIKGQGTMSYVLARHRLGLEYSDEEVEKAVHTFLKRNVRSEWLDRGRITTVALWMKIGFWKPAHDPIATLLRCYDYMPQFKRPEYPPPASNPKKHSDVTPSIPLERDYALVACWPPRAEAIEVRAERLFYLFDQLAGCDAGLARWYEHKTAGTVPISRRKMERSPSASRFETTSSEVAPAKEIDVESQDALVELLGRGRRQEESSASNSDGGRFQARLRNRADERPAVELCITCGAGSPRDIDRLVMSFPMGLTGLATSDRMGLVLASVVRAFDPEWAGVYARELADPAKLGLDEPLVDWLLYLCRELCRNGTTLHQPGDIRGLGGGRLGAIFITQADPPDPANPQHQQNIHTARQAMGL